MSKLRIGKGNFVIVENIKSFRQFTPKPENLTADEAGFVQVAFSLGKEDIVFSDKMCQADADVMMSNL